MQYHYLYVIQLFTNTKSKLLIKNIEFKDILSKQYLLIPRTVDMYVKLFINQKFDLQLRSSNLPQLSMVFSVKKNKSNQSMVFNSMNLHGSKTNLPLKAMLFSPCMQVLSVVTIFLFLFCSNGSNNKHEIVEPSLTNL